MQQTQIYLTNAMNEIASRRKENDPFRKDFCRLCLCQSDEATVTLSSSWSTELFERIFNCTGVRLHAFPSVRSRVCDGCLSQLTICEQFVKQCREVDEKLWDQWNHWNKPELGTERNDTPVSKVQQIQQQPDDTQTTVPAPCEGKSTNEEYYVVEMGDAHHEYELDLPVDRSATAVTLDTGAGNASKVQSAPKKYTKGKNVSKKTPCTVCGTLQQNLKQHMLVHTGERRHVCPVCQQTFAQRGNLTHHMNKHTGQRTYRCEQCDKPFQDPQSLRSHKLLHTAERKFRCEVCDETFKYRCTLVVHLRCHTKDKPFSCSECASSFVTSSGLKKHLRTHTGERPYQCSECVKAFKTSHNLSLHRLVHTKERRFQCDLCDRRFSYKHVLQTHMKVHRKGKET